MAEPFKNFINADTVRHAAQHLRRSGRGFDATAFEAVLLDGLEALEFKARAMRWADALQAALPSRFDRACDLIEGALAPPLPLDADGEPVGLQAALHPEGLAGWSLWGAGEWVARQGQADATRALHCLHAITQRFTAEFAIRPFLAQQPQAVWPLLQRWVDDGSAHVRRLVSEGSRPRLPWGLRLHALVADPAPTLPLLQALQDDTSAYVRRSVANHLNDIAKDHPALVADWVQTHRTGASTAREALLRHASRGLIKAGHPQTLAAWGLSQGFDGGAALALSARRASIGTGITLTVNLQAHRAQRLVVDYAVHHVKANGQSAPKVFKGWRFELAAGEARTLQKTHSLREVTTRRLYPGRHRIELLVNGVGVAEASFDLSP